MILEREYIKNTCKIGQGTECCRYLVCGSKGFECAKITEMKEEIDSRVSKGLMTAKGNNCPGKSMYDYMLN